MGSWWQWAICQSIIEPLESVNNFRKFYNELYSRLQPGMEYQNKKRPALSFHSIMIFAVFIYLLIIQLQCFVNISNHRVKSSIVICDSDDRHHTANILGPVLFLLFINDVSFTCVGQAKLKLFTDDIKLYSSFNVDVFNCGDLQQFLQIFFHRGPSLGN